LSELTGADPRTVRRVQAVGRKKPEAIQQIATGEKTLSEAERETGLRPPKKVYPTDISTHTRKPILAAAQTGGKKIDEIEELSPRTRQAILEIEEFASGLKPPPQEEEEVLPSKEDAALAIGNIESCVEESLGLLGDLAHATGEDLRDSNTSKSTASWFQSPRPEKGAQSRLRLVTMNHC
jgi:hypothetical protein